MWTWERSVFSCWDHGAVSSRQVTGSTASPAALPRRPAVPRQRRGGSGFIEVYDTLHAAIIAYGAGSPPAAMRRKGRDLDAWPGVHGQAGGP